MKKSILLTSIIVLGVFLFISGCGQEAQKISSKDIKINYAYAAAKTGLGDNKEDVSDKYCLTCNNEKEEGCGYFRIYVSFNADTTGGGKGYDTFDCWPEIDGVRDDPNGTWKPFVEIITSKSYDPKKAHVLSVCCEARTYKNNEISQACSIPMAVQAKC